MRREALQVVMDDPQCWSAHRAAGHVTASAWILNEQFDAVLLIHHGKLRRWLQPGGHIEAKDTSGLAAAAREGREETGLRTLKPLGGLFDVDVHLIPGRAEMESHLHYDLRYAFLARAAETPRVSPESRDIGWFRFDSPEVSQVESLRRMAEKTPALLRARLP